MTEEDRAAIRAAVLDALCAPYPTIPRLADRTTARIVAIVDHAPAEPPATMIYPDTRGRP